MTYLQPVDSSVDIASLDDGTHVSAQYNPKDLQIQKNVPWQKHQKGNADGLQYEFTGAEGRTMTLEMLFDGVEENESIAGTVSILETLAKVRDPSSSDPTMRRPHHCVVVWGTVMGGDQRFQCVITQITIKYTMFSSDGRPLRATVTLQLQEATRVSMAANSDSSGGSDGGSGGGDGGSGGGGGGGGGGDGGGDGGGGLDGGDGGGD
jgi:Contractile injection system tube protein